MVKNNRAVFIQQHHTILSCLIHMRCPKGRDGAPSSSISTLHQFLLINLILHQNGLYLFSLGGVLDQSWAQRGLFCIQWKYKFHVLKLLALHCNVNSFRSKKCFCQVSAIHNLYYFILCCKIWNLHQLPRHQCGKKWMYFAARSPSSDLLSLLISQPTPSFKNPTPTSSVFVFPSTCVGWENDKHTHTSL